MSDVKQYKAWTQFISPPRESESHDDLGIILAQSIPEATAKACEKAREVNAHGTVHVERIR